MPCINTKLPMKISEDQERTLKSRFGEAICAFPGKSETWLMLTFEQQVSLYFQGNKLEKGAFVEVSVFGGLVSDACDKMTAKICDALKEVLQIPGDKVYVKYQGTDQWGWNGRNF